MCHEEVELPLNLIINTPNEAYQIAFDGFSIFIAELVITRFEFEAAYGLRFVTKMKTDLKRWLSLPLKRKSVPDGISNSAHIRLNDGV